MKRDRIMIALQQPGRGFTLVEMLVVISIVSILASAAIPFARFGEQRVKERELKVALRDLRKAIDNYKKASDEGRITKKVDTTGYPPSLDVLVEGVVDTKDPKQRKLYFIRRIPADPFSPGVVDGKSQWGLRSYVSDPKSPAAGDDVYDVYSLSTGKGSNGIPYKDW
jgi:general secretion pathway protein G